jgi:hypothetical protein
MSADGLPERFNWAADYRGSTAIVYGHTPVAEAEWQNNTLCIDTGCVFGGKLTALRPDNADFFFDMGRAAISADDTDTALLAFNRYLELAPDSPEAEQVQKWVDENTPGGTGQ